MRKYNLLIIFTAFSLAIFSCSDDDSPTDIINQSNATYEKLATILQVTSDAHKIYRDTLAATSDSLRALFAVGIFLADHDAVDSAYYVNTELIDIEFKNGLNSSISIIEVDDQGEHLTRGGGSKASLSRISGVSGSIKKIKNNKVLVLNPYLDEFYEGSYADFLPHYKGGAVELEIHEFNSNIQLSHVLAMEDYGLVILNTHGNVYSNRSGGGNSFAMWSTATLDKPSEETWTEEKTEAFLKQSGELPTSLFENEQLILGTYNFVNRNNNSVRYSVSINVTPNYIKKSNLDLTGVVVFGNACYSGLTHARYNGNTLAEAFEGKNASSYYGYAFDNKISSKVYNSNCRKFEESFIKRIAQQNDTTGAVHLDVSNKKQFEERRYRYNLESIEVSTVREYRKFIRGLSNSGRYKIPLYFEHFGAGNYKFELCIPKPDTFLTASASYDGVVTNYSAKRKNASGQNVIELSTYSGSSLKLTTLSDAKLGTATGVTAVLEISGNNVDYETGTFSIGGPNAAYRAKLTYQVGGGTLAISSEYVSANSGELTITNFCDDYIEGTFHFKAKANVQNAPIGDITDGKFQIYLGL